MPNATMMIHSPSGTARGQASEIVNETGELARVRDYFCEVLGEATMRDPEQVRSLPFSLGALRMCCHVVSSCDTAPLAQLMSRYS